MQLLREVEEVELGEEDEELKPPGKRGCYFRALESQKELIKSLHFRYNDDINHISNVFKFSEFVKNVHNFL